MLILGREAAMATLEYMQIKDLKPGLKNINVMFIVLEVGPPTITKENREVRTLKVADASAGINVSVWDEPGQLLAPGDIVRLTRGYASLWRQCLTLYSGKNGDIHKVGEFCMLFNEQINMSEPNPAFAGPPPPPAPSLNNGVQNNGGPRVSQTTPSSAPAYSQSKSNSIPGERYSGERERDKLAHKTYNRGGRSGPRAQASARR